MILLCGIASEPPLAMVREQLEELRAPFTILGQRSVDRTEIELEIRAGRVTGELILDGRAHPLESFDGVYLRLMDDRYLPETSGQPGSSPLRLHSRLVHETLLHWADIAPARVVNRPGSMGSNASKPYQAQLIRQHGFLVPETLITNDPDQVVEFLKRHRRVIYKSISGVRSIVQPLRDEDIPRLPSITWCPVQFQQLVEGVDIRVHTVGAEVFATAVRSEIVDYRYAVRQGGLPAELASIDLRPDLAARCLELSCELGLPFAGIDLRLTPDGTAYCLEVNPCPAFSYYEMSTGQPISRALARHLAGLDVEATP
jgi:RimK-like ATP-grasp domain